MSSFLGVALSIAKHHDDPPRQQRSRDDEVGDTGGSRAGTDEEDLLVPGSRNTLDPRSASRGGSSLKEHEGSLHRQGRSHRRPA